MSEFKENEDNVILVSRDGVSFTVSKNVANTLDLIKSMLIEEENEVEIPLPNVDGKTLEKVIQYCEHYLKEPMTVLEKPLKSANLTKIVQEFYADYIINITDEELLLLCEAANYLDNKQLLDLCCAQIASFIKGKTVEEIREKFGIVNDFTPEEEAKVREENSWVENIPDDE
jgi:S-phase kinase-associated protein 1